MRFVLRLTLLSLCLPGLSVMSWAEKPAGISDTASLAPDTAAREHEASPDGPQPPRRWIRPFAEGVAANLGLAAYNIWISQASWARVGPGSIANNFRSGWEWDHDRFNINQFGHPYQGAMYHTSARYHGHGFYAATAYTALGSLQWEYFMEREKVSYNDFITTTLGGAMMGEMTVRIAESILDESRTGPERVLRELGAAAVNPVYAVNRMIDGNTFAPSRRPKSRNRVSEEPARYRITTGANIPFFSSTAGETSDPSQRIPKANTEVLVMYGNAFRAERPYDHFIVNVGMNVFRDPVATVSGRGQLASREIFRTDRGEGIVLAAQNIDYLHNGIYKLGTNGLGGGYAHRFSWVRWWHTLHGEAGFIPVGAVSTEFFRHRARDYNMGHGAYANMRIVVGKSGLGHMALVSDRYWVHTRSGAKGDELIGVSHFETGFPVWRNVGGLLSYASYDRFARYPAHGIRAETTQEVRLKVSYTFE